MFDQHDKLCRLLVQNYKSLTTELANEARTISGNCYRNKCLKWKHGIWSFFRDNIESINSECLESPNPVNQTMRMDARSRNVRTQKSIKF